ncbi:hypothetical protein QR685DRAFT_511645 [Neurospora intermedia]|uniref:Uncharacterized protein n=1 Tax=Neurospora intermedia TaxID=5142 RepID=A0ABR3DQZ2_NEUIN
MRASFALLPALAAMTVASRCRPRTTTSSLATSTLTSAVVSSPTSSADLTSSAVSIIESTTTTTSDEPTTTEASTVEPSTTEPAKSDPPTTSELPTTSEPSTTSEPPTTSELPTTTEEPTTTSMESTTSTAPSSAPTVTGFCLKVITPDVGNKDFHIRVQSPDTNMIFENPTGSNFGLFDLDISTGKMSISGGTWAGYEVYALPPYDSQNLRVIRFTNTLVEYPLRCSNPDGVYITGSVLMCDVSAPWDDGVMRRYAQWNSGNSSPSGAWNIMRDDYVRAGSYNYDLGMFFGDDCSAVGGQ